MFWWWVRPVLSVGNRRPLLDEDLDALSTDDSALALLDKVSLSDGTWPGTWTVIGRAFWKDYLLLGPIFALYVAARIAQPLLLNEIVLYIGGRSGRSIYGGYLFAVGLALCSSVQALVHHQTFFRYNRLGIRMRCCLSLAVYRRLLTINTASFQTTTAAQTVNLVANDANKFEELATYLHYLWEAPLESFIVFGLLWSNIGLPTLFGYSVLFLLIPLQLMFSRRFGYYRKRTMPFTDARVQVVNELTNACETIKMYNWEKAMEQRLNESRSREFSSVSSANRLRALNVAIAYAVLPLISLATFAGAWLSDRRLSTAQIFTTLSFFAMIRTPMTIFLPLAIEKLSEARVAASRIDAFMRLGVLTRRRDAAHSRDEAHALVLRNASFSWTNAINLTDIDFAVVRGSFVGISGSIAAGKSSLLAAILGEVTMVNGELQLNVNSVSYASQSPWIFAGTIRANILLGKEMNEARYKAVVQSCCLDSDLQLFGESGDLTMIGEKGVTLSGGQRARISLARALYPDVDLYLLDDPFAAVDPKVAQKIFDQCIGSRSLLSGKTRLLVTHHTQFLAEADHVITLSSGRLQQSQVRPAKPRQAAVAEELNLALPTEVSWLSRGTPQDKQSTENSELFAAGPIKWKVWLRLFTPPPMGVLRFALLVCVMVATESLYDLTNCWLSVWSAKPNRFQSSMTGAYVFIGLSVGTLVMSLVRTNYFYHVMLRGSDYFHRNMFRGILYTSLQFFAFNPTGRILNRASRDQQILDEILPLSMLDAVQYLLLTLGTVVIIGIVNSWTLLILVLLIPSFWWLRRFYLRSSRQLKQLENTTRSPIFALFSSSIDGLVTIRSLHVHEDFLRAFKERIDANTRAYFTLLAAARWFGLHLDLMTSLLTLITSVASVALRHRIDPAAAALSLACCINLTVSFQWGVRQSAEVENYMTSAERIYEYSELPPESAQDKGDDRPFVQPPPDWPARGTIEFKDYSLRYRADLAVALKNINLRIEDKEKIGIIGRTGSVIRPMH